MHRHLRITGLESRKGIYPRGSKAGYLWQDEISEAQGADREESQQWSTSTVKGSQKEKEPTKEVKGWLERQFLARQEGESFQLARARPFAKQSLSFEMCDFGWHDVILVSVAHAGFMEALGLGKAAWIMALCVCLLWCLHYMAKRTNLPQEIEALGQGRPPYKAAWGISSHLT